LGRSKQRKVDFWVETEAKEVVGNTDSSRRILIVEESLMNFKQTNAMGQALEELRGSTDGTTSITSNFTGDRLRLTYTSVVHYTGPEGMRPQLVRESDRSLSILKDAVKKVGVRFKELANESVKLKELSTNDSFEIIVSTASSPRKAGYYRRFVDLEVG
jgi:hypothetical protein